MSEFISFNKIGRWSREIVVTEKIDGTNAQIFIGEDGEFLTGSRNRWITPGDDNYGFSRWAHEHKDELMTLGVGRHFGEWWGCGIQRGYGLKEKRFSLFNVGRWCLNGQEPKSTQNPNPKLPPSVQKVLPDCVGLVPVLWEGNMNDFRVDLIMDNLIRWGSIASTGFRNPEGIVIFHTSNGALFKKTFEKDQEGKGY